MSNTKSTQEQPAHRTDKRAVAAIAALYIAFFLIWCVGVLLGLGDSQSAWLGLPVWFMISCVLGYVAICIALARVVRRYF